MASSHSAKSVPLLAFEEHFTSSAAESEYGPVATMFGSAIGSKLISLSKGRLEDMSSAGVSKQILSHTPFPSAPSPKLCEQINDELRAAVQGVPDRLAGFATLPMDKPAAAATELKRAIHELGFLGALIDTHTEGVWYDGADYDVFWQTAEELGVPVYIHPCFASEQMLTVDYRGNYPEEVATSLGAFVFGWHAQTGLHFLRLLAGGVFDRFPKLKVVLGHMGELVPYMFEREKRSIGRWGHINRGLQEVWDTNVWTTTSGMFDTRPLKLLLGVSQRERVCLSIDYPFSSCDLGRGFIEDIENQGILKGNDLEDFAYGNACKLFGIKI